MKQAILGVLFFPATAWLCGGRKVFSKRKTTLLFLLCAFLMLVFLKSTKLEYLFNGLNRVSSALKQATEKGTSFVFGYLGGDTIPFKKTTPTEHSIVIFFFQILPIMIVMGSISALMVHWGVVAQLTKLIEKTTKKISILSQSLISSTVLKFFFGQSEVTLFMRTHLYSMTDNDMLSLMAMGMSTTTFAMISFYAFLCDKLGGYSLPHLITAAVVNIFSSLAMAELIVPATFQNTSLTNDKQENFDNTAHALTHGACEGWHIITSIAACTIASMAIVELINQIIAGLSFAKIGHTITLQSILGHVFTPLAWMTGIPWKESLSAGVILAEKTLINEVVALSHITQAVQPITIRTCHILIYSVCAFSNFLSIGLHISIWKMVAHKKAQQARRLAPKAFLVSILAGGFSSALSSLLMGP